jgi:serine/threonine protein kinase/ketosteroid isomerase-like protein
MDELDLGQTIRGFAAGQKILNRYTFVRILGRGGMGVVWLAHDDELEREVALKFLPELVVHDRAVLDDLKRETRRSLALTHHNIVRIYDFAQGPECACISMEYVDGATLSSLRIDQPDKVFEVEALGSLMEQVCSALQYAHVQARIVHRDLKPSNLMMNARGDVKVADFGIARSLTDSVSMLTMARGTSGTLVYMSPQQLDGERASELDDIYSLGATIYELLTGKPPFFSGQIDRLVREKTPPTMAARRADLGVTSKFTIPPHWEKTIAACLAKDPSARPQSALELKDRLLSPTLTPIISSPPSPPPSSPPTLPQTTSPTMLPVSTQTTTPVLVQVSWIQRHRGILIFAIAGLVLIGGIIIWIGNRVSSPEPPTAIERTVVPAPSIVPYASPERNASSTATAAPATTTTPAPTTAPVVPPPPPPTSPNRPRAEIEQMIATHLRAVTSNDPATVVSLYGDQVDFLDEGTKSHDTLAREIADYFARWPTQNFRRTSDVTIEDLSGNEKRVSFSMDFDARNTAGKTSQGAVAITWVVRRPNGDSGFKIISQKQKTLSRTTMSPPEPSANVVAEQIRQFVAEHFRKTERTDCEAVLADYANRVDYFDSGVVGKDFIARDCAAFVKAWPQIRDQLTGTVDVRENGNDEYAVSFSYDFEAHNPAKGKISRGHAVDQWRVENRSGEFRITYHREKVTKRSGQ